LLPSEHCNDSFSLVLPEPPFYDLIELLRKPVFLAIQQVMLHDRLRRPFLNFNRLLIEKVQIAYRFSVQFIINRICIFDYLYSVGLLSKSFSHSFLEFPKSHVFIQLKQKRLFLVELVASNVVLYLELDHLTFDGGKMWLNEPVSFFFCLAK